MLRYTVLIALALNAFCLADNVSFSDTGKRLVICSSSKGKARVVELGAKKPLCVVPGVFARISPDGKHVLTIGSDGKLHRFEVASGKQVWKGSDDAKSFELAPNGQYALVEDRVYATSNGKLVGKWSPPNAFSPDSKALFHGEYDSVKVISLPSGKVENEAKVPGTVARVVASPGEFACAYSPDGRRTAMIILGYPGFQLKRNFDNPDSAISPDGSLAWEGELIVKHKGQQVYKGKLGERVSVWGKGGGFLVGKGRKPFAFFASNGQPIPDGEKNWRVVPGTALGFTYIDQRVTLYNVLSGAKYGETSGIVAVGDSPRGGKLVLVNSSGSTLVDCLATVKKNKLVSQAVP